MPIYACAVCGCFENTVTGGYWAQELAYYSGEPRPSHRDRFRPLCSEHNPAIGKWHGEWPKQRAEGWKVDRRGFIWRPGELAKVQHLGPFTDIVLPPENARA